MIFHQQQIHSSAALPKIGLSVIIFLTVQLSCSRKTTNEIRQPEDDAALPRGFDSEDCEVYQKNSDSNSVADVNIDGSIGTSSSISNLFGGSSCIGNSGGAGVSNQIGNFFASSGTSNGPLGCTEAMDSLGNYVKKKFKQLINRFL